MRKLAYNPVKGLFILNSTEVFSTNEKSIWESIEWREEAQREYKEYGFKNLTLALTARCNLGCPYCWQEHGNDSSLDMTTNTIDFWLDFFLDPKKNNPNKVLYYGGEPTLRMDLIQYASTKIKQLCVERGIPRINQHIFTNGMLLTEQNLNILEEAGAFIVLSLDGDPSVTYQTRGLRPDIYNGTILKAVKSMHSRHMKFGIACTIDNIHFDVEKTARYLVNELRPSSIEFNLRHDKEMVDKMEQETNFSFESLWKAWDIALDANVKVVDLAKRAKAFCIHEALLNSSSGSKNKLSVMNNGYISTYNGAISYQNLQINPYETGWMEKIKSNWKRNIIKNMEKCQNCEMLYICGQGSAFSSYIQYGNVNCVPAYHCYLCKAELEYFKYRLEKTIITSEKNHIVTADEIREVFLL